MCSRVISVLLMACPCLHLQEDMQLSNVLKLLLNPEASCVNHLPPVRPKAGDVFLFSPGENKNAKGMIYMSRNAYLIPQII